jgi:N-acetylneuraminic acid mutarotase
MLNFRYDAASTINNKYAFVSGGHPEHIVGTTIDRYSFEFNKWDRINVELPKALHRHIMFYHELNKIVIIGGVGSKKIMMLEIQETVVIERGVRLPNNGQNDTFKLRIS